MGSHKRCLERCVIVYEANVVIRGNLECNPLHDDFRSVGYDFFFQIIRDAIVSAASPSDNSW